MTLNWCFLVIGAMYVYRNIEMFENAWERLDGWNKEDVEEAISIVYFLLIFFQEASSYDKKKMTKLRTQKC